MNKGFGLILVILLTLILFVIIFASTKFLVPNPQTIKADQQIQKDAQDAVDKYQQKNIKDQTIDTNP